MKQLLVLDPLDQLFIVRNLVVEFTHEGWTWGLRRERGRRGSRKSYPVQSGFHIPTSARGREKRWL